ncbi:unnamed protein product [Mycena citricolor]|uniref:ribonuclease H n=1 Tax=Mycena citricolor TaxID=2018698 RepID=A0AAD2Q252_9AGAR|nr:unnamed protein product [Mycena citricolor]
MLDSLDEKWDPRKRQPEDYEHKMTPKETEAAGERTIDIDQRVTTTGNIADVFRIFTEEETNHSRTAPSREHAENPDKETIELEAYTDGSATKNGREGTEAGAGIYFEDDDRENKAIKVPNELGPSNQIAEMLAIKETIEICPPGAPIHIKTDSMYCVNGLTKSLQKWEDQGFFLAANGDLAKLTITKIRNRRARTRLTWVKGHAGIHGNEEADKLANEGRQKSQPDIIDTQVDRSLILPGAKLRAMTQLVAYKIIRKLKMKNDKYQDALDRRATRRNIEIAQQATEEEGNDPKGAATEAQIWAAIQHKDFSRSIRYFTWMLIHDGYKVGTHWSRIPGHEEKAHCKHCGPDLETSERDMEKKDGHRPAPKLRNGDGMRSHPTGKRRNVETLPHNSIGISPYDMEDKMRTRYTREGQCLCSRSREQMEESDKDETADRLHDDKHSKIRKEINPIFPGQEDVGKDP